jgi:predicted  nucleic acid-binding Zn-ribbon protein
MHPDLEKLVDLQRLESDLKSLEARIAEVPVKTGELEARLAEERSHLDHLKEELASSQKRKKQHEADLQDLEVKRSKYKNQLMEVKTNKEYTAMLHEIEGAEREIRGREDLILVEMEKADELAGAMKQAERAYKAAEERHRGEVKSLQDGAAAVLGRAKTLREARDTLVAAIPEDVKELFERVASRRGVAVAEARDEMCLLCHVRLRPQMWLELRRNEAITQCPQCSRILYYEVQATAVAPEP